MDSHKMKDQSQKTTNGSENKEKSSQIGVNNEIGYLIRCRKILNLVIKAHDDSAQDGFEYLYRDFYDPELKKQRPPMKQLVSVGEKVGRSGAADIYTKHSRKLSKGRIKGFVSL